MLSSEVDIAEKSSGALLRLSAMQQMAIDYLLLTQAEGFRRPIFRTYAMSPCAVTIGRHQRWDRVIDEAACAEFGWEWCRRPTGGGALLHKDEVNYAVIAPRGLLAPVGEHEFRLVFDLIGRSFAAALSDMGFNPTLHAGNRGLPLSQHGLCGRSITGNEIALHNLKIVAAAQRITTAGILQHGTIYLKAPTPMDRFWPSTSGGEGDLAQRWADLGPGFEGWAQDEFAQLLADKFSRNMPVECHGCDLAQSDWHKIEGLAADWTVNNWNKSR